MNIKAISYVSYVRNAGQLNTQKKKSTNKSDNDMDTNTNKDHLQQKIQKGPRIALIFIISDKN